MDADEKHLVVGRCTSIIPLKTFVTVRILIDPDNPSEGSSVVWDKSQGRIIHEIVVDQARWESDDPWEAIDSLSSFAALAYREGGLRADEIAPEIFWNSQVTHYDSQARRNGHYLYVSNSGWKAENIEACRAGLVACGASEIVQIYDDLGTLVPQVGYDISEWRSHYDDFRKSSPLRKDFDVLNDRLFSINHDSFLQRRIEWIKSLPHLEVVPIDAMQHRLEQLFSKNPLRNERRAILLKEERQQEDSIKKKQIIRLATADARQYANKILASLRRLFRNDPKEIGYVFEIVNGHQILWPVSSDAHEDWFLVLDTAKGIALLYGNGDIINGPKPLSEPTRAYLAGLVS